MITHLEQKAFVRKYNSELAIKGYTKLTKASLFQRIENTLKRSRTELKREWASMKSGPSAKPKKMTGFKTGKAVGKAKSKQTGVKSGKHRPREMAMKTGTPVGDSNMAVKRGAKRSDSNMAVKRGAKRSVLKSASAKRGPKKGPVKFSSKIVVAPGAQTERLNDATDRITNKVKSGYYKQSAAARRKAIIRDTALARRIRG